MIREFICDMTLISIQRRLRREGRTLIRVVPKTIPGEAGREAYVVFHV